METLDFGEFRNWLAEGYVGIRSRLEESALLYQQGRYAGALLSVLAAATATSRKRYPRSRHGKTDREAFESFISDELPDMVIAMTGGALCVHGNFLYEFNGDMLKIENVFWKYARNGLMHEGDICSSLEFFESENWSSGSSGDRIRLCTHWIVGLWQITRYAEENADVFADGEPSMRMHVGLPLPEAKLHYQRSVAES